jgi:hypothetical protein
MEFIPVISDQDFAFRTTDPERLPLPSKEVGVGSSMAPQSNRGFVALSAAGENQDEDHENSDDDDFVPMPNSQRNNNIKNWMASTVSPSFFPPPPSALHPP